MNVMVFNVPAETVGALSILNEFYNEVKLCKDMNINWIFVLSKPDLGETDKIKVLRFPWVKKSWWHRLYFDNIIAPSLVKKYNVKKILSFHNVIIPHTNIDQILYLHNSLPFIDYKFTFKENRRLWIYQHIIGRMMIKSIRKANKVIVQTEWMKQACLKKAEVSKDKIDVILPQVNNLIKKFFQPNKESLSTFFYPASEFTYKNHKLIVDACKKLNKGNNNFKVIFTLKGDENDYISQIYKEVEENQLPIEFIGSISRIQVFDFYARTVLLFPSYIETFGLPLLEAKLHRTIILASDCSFSHEILDGYQNAYFFNPFDSNMLSELIKKVIEQNINYVNNSEDNNIFVSTKSILDTIYH